MNEQNIYNPTAHTTHGDPLASTYIKDPMDEQMDDDNFTRGLTKRQSREMAGVIEARPGIIESTHIDPLSDDEDDPWTHVEDPRPKQQQQPRQGTPGMKERMRNAAGGATDVVYGVATGDKDTARAGKEALGFES
ncbi:hypothetical protein F5I97DRAFT_1842957, partial [Phlebopus sp. FC_14]